MSLWSNVDANTGAPKHLIGTGIGAKNIATANATVAGVLRGDEAYQNVSTSVFVSGMKLGVFGVDAAEKSNTTGEGPKTTHAGWVVRKEGTGFINSVTISTPGAGYSNGYVVITGGGGSNANISFTVNGGGNIVSVLINNQGAGFNTAPVLVANTANTAVASLVAVMGGRTGRKTYETLVAMGSMTPGANTDNAYFPE